MSQLKGYTLLITWLCYVLSPLLLVGQTSLTTEKRIVEFQSDIMPIFSRYGCNAAECHGGATGQGDFKLSLFGGDWRKDYWAVTQQLEGRRINLTSPEKSLLLTKPLEAIEHGGGKRFADDSPAAQSFLKWVKAGASETANRVVTGIEVRTSHLRVLDQTPIELEVFEVSNLGRRNVSSLASISTGSPALKRVDPDDWGNAPAKPPQATLRYQVNRPGKYSLVVSHLGFTESLWLIRPFPNEPINDNEPVNDSSKKPTDLDIVVGASLEELGVAWPADAPSHVLVRRLYYDLLGRPPTATESKLVAAKFDPSESDSNLERLVDQLMATEEYAAHWNDWTRQWVGYRARDDESENIAFYQWLQQWVRQDRPADEQVHFLLTSLGGIDSQGSATNDRDAAAIYHQGFRRPGDQAESVANAFLGMQLSCANCHRHPLDQWTQDDYHGLTAIFATLDRGKIIRDKPDGFAIHPVTGKPAVPRLPGGKPLEGTSMAVRQSMAKSVVTSDRFRNALVNRIWKKLMGRGIVEPVGDLRPSNPPLDKRLLRHLAETLIENDFRMKPLIREIVLSRIYRAASFPKHLQEFLAGYHPKPMDAAKMYFETEKLLLVDPPRRSLAQRLIPGAQEPSLELLCRCGKPGSSDRETGTNAQTMGLREKLHLINGDYLNRWLASPKSWLKQQSIDRPIETLDNFYRRALSRPMTKQERIFWKQQFREQGQGSPMLFLEDAIWSVVNSREYLTIH